jgi:hypothetical protein
MIFGEEYKITRLFVTQIPPDACHFLPRMSKYFPQYLILEHPQSMFIPQLQKPSFRQFAVLYSLTVTFLHSKREADSALNASRRSVSSASSQYLHQYPSQFTTRHSKTTAATDKAFKISWLPSPKFQNSPGVAEVSVRQEVIDTRNCRQRNQTGTSTPSTEDPYHTIQDESHQNHFLLQNCWKKEAWTTRKESYPATPASNEMLWPMV